MKKHNIFKEVPVSNVRRNLFDLSHEVKMSGKFGYLYPVLLMDCIPGDTIRDQMTALVRFAPMLAPVMHRIDVTTHFFFVPNRLLNENWEQFITGGQDGTDEVIMPYVTPSTVNTNDALRAASLQPGTLWDYLGLPVLEDPGASGANLSATQQISILPFVAYQKIFNDYYRDPNIDDEIELPISLQGPIPALDFAELNVIQKRGWEKDYYTSALPWAQRGAEVLMPIGGIGTPVYRPVTTMLDADGAVPPNGSTMQSTTPDGLLIRTVGEPVRLENLARVDFENSSVTINDFRRTLAIQRWLENNARGGGRYIEQIQGHFNVRVPDYRLQRAEYIGGGKQPVTLSEVVATAQTDTADLGQLGGHGISVGKSNRFTYRCQEHGFIIGIMSIMPRTAYSQGLDKLWTRSSKFDYAWPELANLGEQEIKSKELFMDLYTSGDEENETTFGYIPRYAEYKFKNDRIAGEFRTTLAFWHLGRFFIGRPVLDSDFLAMNEGGSGIEDTFRRIFAFNGDRDYLWIQLYHHLTAKRPLPYFGVPQII